jgi:hypothetical protein
MKTYLAIVTVLQILRVSLPLTLECGVGTLPVEHKPIINRTVNSEQNSDRKYQNADLIEDLRANRLSAYVQLVHKPFLKEAGVT